VVLGKALRGRRGFATLAQLGHRRHHAMLDHSESDNLRVPEEQQ